MIPVHQIEKMIPDLTGCAVVIIAGCSFVLSFFNLRQVAIEAGIDPRLSGLWPVCVDALLCAGSLMILRSSIRDESSLEGWLVLLIFTGVSTLFNVVHSPEGWINQAAHAIPPVSLCVSIELLMMTIKSDLTARLEQGNEPHCTCNTGTEYTAYTGPDEPKQIECIHEPVPMQQDEQMINIPAKPPERLDTAEKIKQHFNEHPGDTMSAAARTLGISRTTVSRHLNNLISAGFVQVQQ